jgi:hypothetical protein
MRPCQYFTHLCIQECLGIQILTIRYFNSFGVFLGHPVQCVPQKSTLYRNYLIVVKPTGFYATGN